MSSKHCKVSQPGASQSCVSESGVRVVVECRHNEVHCALGMSRACTPVRAVVVKKVA